MTQKKRFSHDLCFVSAVDCTAFLLAGEGGATPAAGAEVQMTRIAAALARQSVRVAFVVLDLPGTPVGTPHGLPVSVFTAYRPGKGLPVLRYFTNTLPGLWRALKRADARAYYVRGAGGLAGITALFCKRRGARFILAVANDHDLDPEPPLPGLQDRALYKFARRRADAIVVQTRSQAERLMHLRLNGTRGVLIPSACEVPEKVAVECANRTVLWAGRGRAVKRPGLLVELARMLPQVRFTMALAPVRRDEDLYAEVRDQALSLPNVEFLGGVPFSEMPGLYSRTWVLVNTSESEGFPNTFMEAWIRGIPVVATVDPDGLLSRGGLGWHCAGIEEMAKAVQRLWEDADLRRDTGQRAAEYVIGEHSPEVVMLRYLDLLASLGVQPAIPPSHTDIVGASR